MTTYISRSQALSVLHQMNNISFDAEKCIEILSATSQLDYDQSGFQITSSIKHKTLKHLIVRSLKFHATDAYLNSCGVASPSYSTLTSRSCDFKTERQLIDRIKRVVGEVESLAETRRKAKASALKLAQELAKPYIEVFGEEAVIVDATGVCRGESRPTAHITIKYNGYTALIGESGFQIENQHTLKKDDP